MAPQTCAAGPVGDDFHCRAIITGPVRHGLVPTHESRLGTDANAVVYMPGAYSIF